MSPCSLVAIFCLCFAAYSSTSVIHKEVVETCPIHALQEGMFPKIGWPAGLVKVAMLALYLSSCYWCLLVVKKPW